MRQDGLYSWKPWVIQQGFKLAEEGDVVLYHDCGRGLRYMSFLAPKKIIEFALKYGAFVGVTRPNFLNKDYTHSSCFEQMKCDNSLFYNAGQVEATISAWRVDELNKKFIEEWLKYAKQEKIMNPECNVCSKENKNFVAHRFDQSVLTNLVLKYKRKQYIASFQINHLCKSMSLIELDLRRDIFSRTILSVILRIYRLLGLKKF